MARRVFQFVAGVVLLLATLTPLANCFDTWDKTSQPPAQDTEIHLTALFVVAGFAMVLPKLIRRIAGAAVASRHMARRVRLSASPRALCWAMPEPSASPPPLPLRI